MRYPKLALVGLRALTVVATDAFAFGTPPDPIGGGVTAPSTGGRLSARRQRVDHVGREARSRAGILGQMPWWVWVWPLAACGVLVAKYAAGAGGAVVKR